MDDQARRNDPLSKHQRGPIPSEQHKQQNESMTRRTLMDLDDDALLRSIVDFLPGHFRFVAGVNRRLQSLYDDHHSTPNTFYMAAMASDATRTIWLEEDETNVRKDGCRLAAKYGNLEALQWLRSHDCRWNGYVCREAAGEGHLHILQWARSQAPPLSMGHMGM